MRKIITLTFVMLMLISTWIAFEIEKYVFLALAPHWEVIVEFFRLDTGRRRNRGESVLFVLVLLFAIGVPVAVSAISGYALSRIEPSSNIKTPGKRMVAMTFFLVLTGGIMVIVGRGENVGLQIWGGIVMLLGTITLFTLAWASRFSKKV